MIDIELVVIAEFLKERDQAGLTPDEMDDDERLESARRILERYHAALPARLTVREREAAWASLRMISDAIEQLFGPIASLESEEGTLHRGPEFHHRAEAIIEALKRVQAAALRFNQETK